METCREDTVIRDDRAIPAVYRRHVARHENHPDAFSAFDEREGEKNYELLR